MPMRDGIAMAYYAPLPSTGPRSTHLDTTGFYIPEGTCYMYALQHLQATVLQQPVISPLCTACNGTSTRCARDPSTC